MGYTLFTKKLVQKVLDNNNIESVLDLGSQNDYDIGGSKPPFVSEWYERKGISYSCVDLNGDNNAFEWDLSRIPEVIKGCFEYDLIVDAGTSEHVVQSDKYMRASFHEGHITSMYPIKPDNIEEGYYNCWWNKFNLCKKGGFIISENPKRGHWPEHGYTYVDFNTYCQLSSVSGLMIVEIGEHPASGNSVDGWEIFCVMKKLEDRFPSFNDFKSKVQVYSK